MTQPLEGRKSFLYWHHTSGPYDGSLNATPLSCGISAYLIVFSMVIILVRLVFGVHAGRSEQRPWGVY